MIEITQEAIELLQYLVKYQDAFSDYFNASDISHRKGGKKEENKTKYIKPLLEELAEEKLLVPSKELFRQPRYLLNVEKAEEFLKELEEEQTIYTQEYRDALEEEIKNYKKFIVTTAVMGKEVNKPFVQSLRNYAKRNNALMLVLPCEDVASRGKKAKAIELSPELDDFRVIFKDTYINKNLCLCAIKVSAKQINPLTGLDRMAVNREASIIVASPKVFLKYVPNMHYNIPPAIMTTGAVTINNYDTDKYMSKRTSVLAENDHAYGAVIVEVEDEDIFHFRHVQASSYNSITDMGFDYLPNGKVERLEGAVMIMGDSHTGYHDKELHFEAMRLAKETGVSTVVLHDVFNGTSISHHDNNKGITKAIKAQENKLGLEKECEAVKNYIKAIENTGVDVVIPEANHNSHLLRFLEEGRYVGDPMNYKFSLKLALAATEGKNPLQYAIESLFGYMSDAVRWLKVDESYRKYGVECGLHGDKGANGSKGSLTIFEKGLGNCVTAHTHTAAIQRNVCSVGTMSSMDMGYNSGLSNWTHTCCLVYKNGTKQLINFIPSNKDEYKCTI